MTKSTQAIEKTEKTAVKPVMTAKQLINGAPAIDKESRLAGAAGVKLENRYQIIAVSVLHHVAKHGDISVARNMMAAFPQSLQGNQMLRFLETFGPIRVLTADDVKDGQYAGLEEGTIVYDKTRKLKLAEAMEKPWWKTMKPAVYHPLDLQAEIVKLLDRVTRQQKKGVSADKGDKIDDATVQALRALVKPAAIAA